MMVHGVPIGGRGADLPCACLSKIAQSPHSAASQQSSTLTGSSMRAGGEQRPDMSPIGSCSAGLPRDWLAFGQIPEMSAYTERRRFLREEAELSHPVRATGQPDYAGRLPAID